MRSRRRSTVVTACYDGVDVSAAVEDEKWRLFQTGQKCHLVS